MDFSSLQTEVQRRAEDSGASVWSAVEVKAAINDGYEDISEHTEWYERSATVTTDATNNYYDLTNSSILSDTFLSPRAVFNSTTNRWLDMCDVRELDLSRVQWENNTGQPQKWFIRGLWHLGIWPKAVASLSFRHSAIPAALSASSDTPGFPQEFHFALVEYALADLFAQDGEPKKAEAHWRKYFDLAASLKAFVDNRQKIDRVGALG